MSLARGDERMLAAPELDFRIEGAEAVPRAASPQLALKLRIDCGEGQTIHTALLRCQIHIEAVRRHYENGEQSKLFDLFGEPHDWGRTLRNMLWTRSDISVPGFTSSTLVDLPVPCTYDFNRAAVKYFDALEGGEVPLCVLFNGTVFYSAAGGALQVTQIPWEKEAAYRLPVHVWRQMMQYYHPNLAWLDLHKDVFDRLRDYKRRHALATWEETIEHLLPPVEEPVPSR